MLIAPDGPCISLNLMIGERGCLAYLLKWIVYGVAILSASGIAGILAGKIIGFSESADDKLPAQQSFTSVTVCHAEG
jgi:hypothetical protein